MVSMKRIVLNDFSGGITDGAVTSDRQMRTARGFVLSDQKTLAPQWPLWADEHGLLRVEHPDFWLDDQGRVVACAVADGAVEKRVVWSPPSGNYRVRVCGHIRWRMYDDRNWYPAAVLRYENVIGDVKMVLVVGRYSAVTVSGVTFQVPAIVQDLYRMPKVDADMQPEGATWNADGSLKDKGAFPRARVACMWDDFVVLGDIEWSGKIPSNPAGANSAELKRYSNYIWISDSLDPSKFQVQYPVAVAEDGAQIVGLYPTDEGLLVLTNRTYGSSGVLLIRGNPSTYWADPASDGLSRELVAPLDVAVGAESRVFEDSSCYWPEKQSVLFVTGDSRLVQYRNGRVTDISPTSQTVKAPAMPITSRGNVSGGGVATFNDWVVFAQRYGYTSSSRLFALRAFGDEGAWTELSVGLVGSAGDGANRTLHSIGGVGVALVQESGSLTVSATEWEYDFVGLNVTPSGNDVAEPFTPEQASIPTSRVQVPTPRLEPVRSQLTTRSYGDETPHVEKWWHQVGVVAGGTGTIRTIRTQGLLEDGTVADYEVDVFEQVSGAFSREIVVPAFGPAPSCQVTVTADGDVKIERLTLWFEPAAERW